MQESIRSQEARLNPQAELSSSVARGIAGVPGFLAYDATIRARIDGFAVVARSGLNAIDLDLHYRLGRTWG